MTNPKDKPVRFGKADWMAAGALLALLAGVYLLLAYVTDTAFAGSSGYYTYTLQAMAWRRGQLSLGQDYPWLELAVYKGDWYVSFPPVPTLIILPLTWIFGMAVPDNLLVKLYGAAAMLLAYAALRRRRWPIPDAGFAALCAVTAGSVLPLAGQGAVWYQAQMLALCLTMGSIFLAARGKVTWALFLYALSVGCRPFNVSYGPAVMLLGAKSLKARSLKEAACRLRWGIVLGLAVAAAMAAYNMARFSNPLEFGTNYLPEFMRSDHGEFSLSHLADNIRKYVLGLPLTLGGDGTLQVKTFGFSLFLANPMLIWLVARAAGDALARRMTREKLMTIGLFLAHMFLLLLHRTFGGFQFGARYAVDLLPYFVLWCLWRKGVRGLRLWEWVTGALAIPLSVLGAAMMHIPG